MPSHARVLLRRPYVAVRNGLTDILFERRYGVTTAEERSLEQLNFAEGDRRRYVPARLTRLRRILRRNEVGPDDVFIDLGSGMGRVVLQAAMMYRFRRVIGVEVVPELHEIARMNVERVRRRLRTTDVTLIKSDVLDFAIPDDVTVAFLNNPFVGETFRTVIDRLLASVDRRPRSLRIIYGNPVEEPMLLATGRIELVRQLRGMRPTREWSRSNAFRLYRVDLA